MLRSIIVLTMLLSFGIAFWGCSGDEDNPVVPGSELRADCIGCHQSESMLRATAAPDTTPHNENPGEG